VVGAVADIPVRVPVPVLAVRAPVPVEEDKVSNGGRVRRYRDRVYR